MTDREHPSDGRIPATTAEEHPPSAGAFANQHWGLRPFGAQ